MFNTVFKNQLAELLKSLRKRRQGMLPPTSRSRMIGKLIISNPVLISEHRYWFALVGI